MAARDILPNWKECSSPQNMRKWQEGKLTAVSVCPLQGQYTPLCSRVFMLCLFPIRHLKKKTLSIYFNILCSERKFNLVGITDAVIVKIKCCSVSQILAITSTQVSSVNSSEAELPTHGILLFYLLTPVCRVPCWLGALSYHTLVLFNTFLFLMAA